MILYIPLIFKVMFCLADKDNIHVFPVAYGISLSHLIILLLQVNFPDITEREKAAHTSHRCPVSQKSRRIIHCSWVDVRQQNAKGPLVWVKSLITITQ